MNPLACTGNDDKISEAMNDTIVAKIGVPACIINFYLVCNPHIHD